MIGRTLYVDKLLSYRELPNVEYLGQNHTTEAKYMIMD